MQLTASCEQLSNTRLFRHWSVVNETHIPAIQDPSAAHPRVSRQTQDSGRQGGAAGSPRQGSRTLGRVKPDCRLPRAARLNDDVRISVLRSATRRRGRWFIVHCMRNEVGHARVLVRVAKKIVRSAVGRNRVRRCVREVFRLERASLPASDYFVSLVRPYTKPTLLDARQDLGKLLQSDH
jgi:ribonuclease P protein component